MMFADLGTRIYYAQHGGFDTHAGELVTHGKLWNEVDGAVGDFWDDLVEHDRADDTAVLVFTEFGRRIKDNGSGTDHGSGGVAFVIGGGVKGGLYGEYPSVEGRRTSWRETSTTTTTSVARTRRCWRIGLGWRLLR